MEISILGLIGIAIATMFFGYFFGLLEGRGQGYKRGRKEGGQDRQEPLTRSAATFAEPRTERPPGLLVLELDQADRPRLHIDGNEVDVHQVATEQRRRLIDLMLMLKPWVDPAGAPASNRPSARPPSPAVATENQSGGGVRGMPASTPGAPETTATPTAHLSLVTQIDTILQGHMAGTRLAGKGIRLAESLQGGAIVFVGTQQYDGVDKVPDPEIQAAIRGAIAEWEKKYTPG
jgi:hypothetical protein